MNERELLNNTKIIPLPKTNVELGQQIVSIADEGCRAIIIDFLQGVMVVHPSGAGLVPELTEESISYLLKTQHLQMIDGEHDLQDLEAIIQELVPTCTHVALNKAHQRATINTSKRILWTNLIFSHIALLIHQKTPQSEWIVASVCIKPTNNQKQD